MHQATIGTQHPEIAGEEELLATAIGCWEKFRLRQIWPTPIARGEIPTLDANLAYRVRTHRLTVFIKQQDFFASDRIADRDKGLREVTLLRQKYLPRNPGQLSGA